MDGSEISRRIVGEPISFANLWNIRGTNEGSFDLISLIIDLRRN